MTQVTRTFDLLERYEKHFMKKEAFSVKLQRQWITYSTRQYIDYAYRIAWGLLALGLKKGDKVATISSNRPEWNFVDMGMSMAGIVHVPLYTSLTGEEYQNILLHSDARILFVSDKGQLNRVKGIVQQISGIEAIYTFNNIDGEKHWLSLVDLGESQQKQRQPELEAIKERIVPNDFATLIYTSGTTGNSKGVMLSHKNLVQNFLAATEVFGLTPEDRYMNILPLCHVGGRMGNYQTQYSGCNIYYPENMGTIAADMREVKPHGFDAVPRILEKIFDTILAKGKKLKRVKKIIFFWAVDLGLRYQPPHKSSTLYRWKLKIADKLIFSKWREAIGGCASLVGCGGAALQPRVERVFWAAGIKILNMYGLTETSPIITINRKNPPDLKLGSVGSVIPGVEVTIATDGEILCRGHNVMLGYYKDPELTQSAFTRDGWFCTGDIGKITEERYLEVTDRKKEIFKLSSGKFIAPQTLENRFKESLFIEQIMVIGEHEKFASAIIAPDFTYIKEWCAANNIPFSNNQEMLHNDLFMNAINKEIEQLNQGAAEYERIRRFRLIPDVWSPETGGLSPTLKLKRNVITERYQDVISQIYSKQ